MSQVKKRFVCERCRQPFATKQQLTRHMNKKKPCVSVEPLQITQTNLAPYTLHLKVQNVEPTELIKKIQDIAGHENVLSFAFEKHEPKQDHQQLPQPLQKPPEEEHKQEQIDTRPEQIDTRSKQVDNTKPEETWQEMKARGDRIVEEAEKEIEEEQDRAERTNRNTTTSKKI